MTAWESTVVSIRELENVIVEGYWKICKTEVIVAGVRTLL